MNKKISDKDAHILSEITYLELNDMNPLAFLLFIFFAFLEAAFVVIYAAYYDSLSVLVFYLTLFMIAIGCLVLWNKKNQLKTKNLIVFILYILYSLFILHLPAIVGGNSSYSFDWFIAVYLFWYPIHMLVFKLYQLRKKNRSHIEILFYFRMSAISFWAAYFAYFFCMFKVLPIV